ncbi:hypothetical protein MFRU_011g01340 [Monilinia fructicola]|nr:hypothetical protein MFRU_011g01340 [Monilinia fructicola]
MGNTHSHHHNESRGNSTRCREKRNSRTNSEHSNHTTSSSFSSSFPSSSPSISRSQSTRTPSLPRKFLARRSCSLSDSHKIRDLGTQESETIQAKPPIRIGYPYYEEVTMLAEKGEKKHRRQSARRSLRLS